MHLLLGPDNTGLLRYEPGDIATVIATRDEPGMEIPVGMRVTLEEEHVATAVWRTGRAARHDDLEGPPGSIAAEAMRRGVRTSAGAPIIVEGRMWGAMVAVWRQHQPVSDIEGRIAQFTELVATAISNAQARADLAASRARIVVASDEAGLSTSRVLLTRERRSWSSFRSKTLPRPHEPRRNRRRQPLAQRGPVPRSGRPVPRSGRPAARYTSSICRMLATASSGVVTTGSPRSTAAANARS